PARSGHRSPDGRLGSAARRLGTGVLMRWRAPLGLAAGLAVAVLAAGCAAAPAAPPPWEPWQTTRGHDSPLAGRIWEVGAGRAIARARLGAALAGARFVRLGENPDTPDPHRLRAWLVRGLIARGRRPAVGFEMFETTDAPAIARSLAAAPADAAGLGDAVDW